ncbi:MAG: glycosyltransferase [Chlorobium sp.]|nr:glycosyltransferase [Chlorobium sp.]
MKVVMVTNIPAPYRIPILNRVAACLGVNFLVIFCARIEPNRQWDFEQFDFSHVYLKENFSKSKGFFIHNNLDVISVLRQFRPDVVITTGFNPTFLYAWLYALLSGCHHVPMTDGWLLSESALSRMHKVVRHLVYRTSRAFIGASKKSLDLYRSYGVAESSLFQSHLCIDNKRFSNLAQTADRQFDIMFSGQFIERKMPDFFVDVACKVNNMRGAVKVLLLGDGPLKDHVLKRFTAAGIEFTDAGFVSQEELPSYYSRAKLLLFTTNNDPWGIVANEALASGTPVVTSPNSGAAYDLVVDGWNGYVLESNVDLWAEKVVELLSHNQCWSVLHFNALKSVEKFNFDNAADGIVAAAEWACLRSGSR